MEGEEITEVEIRNNVYIKSEVDLNVEEGENYEPTLEYNNGNSFENTDLLDVTSIKDEEEEEEEDEIKFDPELEFNYSLNDAETDPLSFDDTVKVKTEIKAEEGLIIKDIADIISQEESTNKRLEINYAITSPLDQDISAMLQEPMLAPVINYSVLQSSQVKNKESNRKLRDRANHSHVSPVTKTNRKSPRSHKQSKVCTRSDNISNLSSVSKRSRNDRVLSNSVLQVSKETKRKPSREEKTLRVRTNNSHPTDKATKRSRKPQCSLKQSGVCTSSKNIGDLPGMSKRNAKKPVLSNSVLKMSLGKNKNYLRESKPVRFRANNNSHPMDNANKRSKKPQCSLKQPGVCTRSENIGDLSKVSKRNGNKQTLNNSVLKFNQVQNKKSHEENKMLKERTNISSTDLVTKTNRKFLKESRPDIQSKNNSDIPRKQNKTKTNFCEYCRTLKSNFSRHLFSKHSNETSVIACFKGKHSKLERLRMLNRIRLRGNRMYNQMILSKNNSIADLLLQRRPKKNEQNSHSSYIICKSCGGIYKRKSFYCHARDCVFSGKIVPKRGIRYLKEYGEELQPVERSIVKKASSSSKHNNDNAKVPCSDSSSGIVADPKRTKRKNYCMYCKTWQTNIPRHIFSKHSMEPSVIAYHTIKDNDNQAKLERLKILNKIRRRGNLMYNQIILAKDKTNVADLILERGLRKDDKDTLSSYIICKNCGGIYRRQTFYLHVRYCVLNEPTKAKRFSQERGRELNPVVRKTASSEGCEDLQASLPVPLLSDSLSQSSQVQNKELNEEDKLIRDKACHNSRDIITTTVRNSLHSIEESGPGIHSKNTGDLARELKKTRRNFCIHCKSLQTNFLQHFFKKHPNDPSVLAWHKIKGCDKQSQLIRRHIFDKVRCKGNHIYNEMVLAKKGKKADIVLKKRSRNDEQNTHSSYIMCKSCGGIYRKRKFWQHARKCVLLSNARVSNNSKTMLTQQYTSYFNSHGCKVFKKIRIPFKNIKPLNCTIAQLSSVSQNEVKQINFKALKCGHFCLYCKTKQANLKRHLFSKHPKESLVLQHGKILGDDQEAKNKRYAILSRIRLMGILLHNKMVLAKQFPTTDLLSVKRLRTKVATINTCWIACKKCSSMYQRKYFYIHARKCAHFLTKEVVSCNDQLNTHNKNLSYLKQYGRELCPIETLFSQEKSEVVLSSMKHDKITKMSCSDPLIVCIFDKDIVANSKLKPYVRTKIRYAGKLLINTQKRDSRIKSFEDCFSEEYVDVLISAIEELCGCDHTTKSVAVKYFNQKIIWIIKESCRVLMDKALNNKDDGTRHRVTNFLSHFLIKWKSLTSEVFGKYEKRLSSSMASENQRLNTLKQSADLTINVDHKKNSQIEKIVSTTKPTFVCTESSKFDQPNNDTSSNVLASDSQRFNCLYQTPNLTSDFGHENNTDIESNLSTSTNIKLNMSTDSSKIDQTIITDTCSTVLALDHQNLTSLQKSTVFTSVFDNESNSEMENTSSLGKHVDGSTVSSKIDKLIGTSSEVLTDSIEVRGAPNIVVNQHIKKKRLSWSHEAKTVVYKAFEDCLKHKYRPGLKRCRELIIKEHVLANRSPTQVNLLIDNWIRGKSKLPEGVCDENETCLNLLYPAIGKNKLPKESETSKRITRLKSVQTSKSQQLRKTEENPETLNSLECVLENVILPFNSCEANVSKQKTAVTDHSDMEYRYEDWNRNETLSLIENVMSNPSKDNSIEPNVKNNSELKGLDTNTQLIEVTENLNKHSTCTRRRTDGDVKLDSSDVVSSESEVSLGLETSTDSSGEDVCSTSHSKTKRKRMYWSQNAKCIVYQNFKDLIAEKSRPGISKCKELIKKEILLKGRSPVQVNLLVDNWIRGKTKLPKVLNSIESSEIVTSSIIHNRDKQIHGTLQNFPKSKDKPENSGCTSSSHSENVSSDISSEVQGLLCNNKTHEISGKHFLDIGSSYVQEEGTDQLNNPSCSTTIINTANETFSSNTQSQFNLTELKELIELGVELSSNVEGGGRGTENQQPYVDENVTRIIDNSTQVIKPPSEWNKEDDSYVALKWLERKKRTPWSDEAKIVVYKAFKDCILNNFRPGHKRCRELISRNAVLANRTPMQVNILVDNWLRGKCKIPTDVKFNDAAEDSVTRFDDENDITVLASPAMTRKRWSEEEKSLVIDTFHDCIAKKVRPGRLKCQQLISKHSILNERTPAQINSIIDNWIRGKSKLPDQYKNSFPNSG